MIKQWLYGLCIALMVTIFTMGMAQARTVDPLDKPAANLAKEGRLLKLNQKKWLEKRLKYYQFTMQRSCFCAPDYLLPVTVTVDREQIVNAKTSTGQEAKDRAMTVTQLFAMIDEAVKGKAASLTVKYDAQYGYPTLVSIDRSRRIADEEISIQASNLKPLSNVGQAVDVSECKSPRPQMCTREYRPVCGISVMGAKKTYGNGCTACSDTKVKGYWAGACQ